LRSIAVDQILDDAQPILERLAGFLLFGLVMPQSIFDLLGVGEDGFDPLPYHDPALFFDMLAGQTGGLCSRACTGPIPCGLFLLTVLLQHRRSIHQPHPLPLPSQAPANGA